MSNNIDAAQELLRALEDLLNSDLVHWFPPTPETPGAIPWGPDLLERGAPVLAARAAIAKARAQITA
jgi:hypothetical protein